MKTPTTVSINAKDLQKYSFNFSDTGSVIDELAYCAKQWTSNDLYENNMEYEPSTPYNFDYEADLFEATKTTQQLREIIKLLLDQDIQTGVNTKLQAGAYLALNHSEKWQELLQAYKEKLEEDHTDSISEFYNNQLQKEIDNYQDDQYREWLHGDHRDYAGVVYEIAKYFTDERDGSYDQKTDVYTFALNDEDIQNAKDHGYNKKQLKQFILSQAHDSGNAIFEKHRQENEKRRAEQARLKEYKQEQAEKEKVERIAKLKSMTL